jgi:hypothetical protein
MLLYQQKLSQYRKYINTHYKVLKPFNARSLNIVLIFVACGTLCTILSLAENLTDDLQYSSYLKFRTGWRQGRCIGLAGYTHFLSISRTLVGKMSSSEKVTELWPLIRLSLLPRISFGCNSMKICHNDTRTGTEKTHPKKTYPRQTLYRMDKS